MNCNIVLVEPAIPQNTGNIARLTAALNCRLHCIEPMKFRISDKEVKRAGLDYWPEVRLVVHGSWDEFLETSGAERSQLWFFSTKAGRDFSSVEYRSGDYLIFGSESQGLAEVFHLNYADRMLRIPMENPRIRSFNLANAAAVALFEARRSIRTQG